MRLVSGSTPTLGDVGKRRLPSGALGYLNTRSVIEMSAALAAAIGVAYLIAPNSWRTPLVVGLIVLYVLMVVVDLVIINQLIVRRTSYTVTSEFMYIVKGAVLRRTMIVPMGQVLSVDTMEGPLLSRRGFASVRIRCVTIVERLGPLSHEAVHEVRAAARHASRAHNDPDD